MKIKIVFLAFFLLLSSHTLVQAADLYLRGKVTRIVSEQEIRQDDKNQFVQIVEVERPDTSELVTIQAGSQFQPLDPSKKIKAGQTIVISQQEKAPGETEWVLIDTAYRIPVLAGLVGLFFLLVIGIARLQGILSIVGMALSFGVLTLFIIPQIFSGGNPIVISIVGAMIIGAGSMYLSHGINLKSHIAFGSIVTTLSFVSLLSYLVLHLANMSGTGSEESLFLQVEPSLQVNLQGLLLAGIVLGTLGILDDICIAQVAVIKELLHSKPSITTKELISRGLAVGKDHIASLVNTLILAYAGASLPLFLLFTLYNTQPWWVVLNSEMIAEEIVRTVSGSIGLVLAVPLSTIIAAIILPKAMKR